MEKTGEPFDEAESFPNDELGSISNHIVQLYAQWQQTIKDRDLAHEAAMREEQEKIRIKRQLTNNINHELKTPVASIQVCLETLLSGISLSEEKSSDFGFLYLCTPFRTIPHICNDVFIEFRFVTNQNQTAFVRLKSAL